MPRRNPWRQDGASGGSTALRTSRVESSGNCRSPDVDDLRVPPGNRLEALKGDRAGQYSIRVNDQYRICFRWTAAGAADVEIVDYH